MKYKAIRNLSFDTLTIIRNCDFISHRKHILMNLTIYPVWVYDWYVSIKNAKVVKICRKRRIKFMDVNVEE